MLIKVSYQNPIPLYQQIVEEIRRKITSGELKAGDPLPSIRQLAAELTTSVITTKRAYAELELEGLIYTRPGMGSFVAESAEKGNLTKDQELEHKILEMVVLAKARGLPLQTLVELVSKIYFEEEESK